MKSIRAHRKMALVLLIVMTAEWVLPTAAFALTDGPTQPETHAFEPVGTTEMVDLFSGDFVYNIPLFDLPGPNGSYPFNISYHSGVSMDEEASWVGLGFSLNPGAIDRNMRGIPDDANGAMIKTTMDMKDNITYGVGIFGSVAPEIWTTDLANGIGSAGNGNGSINFSTAFNLYYNTYKGIGFNMNTGISMSVSNDNSTSGGSFGLNVNLDSEEGPGVSPNLSFNVGMKKNASESIGSLGAGYSVNFSSRRGLTDMSFSFQVPMGNHKETNYSKKEKKNVDVKASNNARFHSSSISFAASGVSPSIDMPMVSKNINFNLGAGLDPGGVLFKFGVTGYYNEDKPKYKNQEKEWPAYGYMYLQNGSAAENAGKRPLMDFTRERDGLVYENSPNMAIPVMSQDIYNVQGQGVGGMFRAYRNDIGVLFSQNTKSVTNGGGFGFEAGINLSPPPPAASSTIQISGEGAYNHAENMTRRWDNDGDLQESRDNGFIAANDFTGWDDSKPLYEPVFFKRPGEMVSHSSTHEMDDRIGGTKAARMKMNGFGVSAGMRNSSFQEVTVQPNNTRIGELSNKRRPRNMAILPIKNSYISACPDLGEYASIVYIDGIHSATEDHNHEQPLDRNLLHNVSHGVSDNISDHTGAMTTTNSNGMRYVYALPVYNNVQVDQTFSVAPQSSCSSKVAINGVSGTNDANIHKQGNAQTSDQFRNKTVTPPYAHTFLLTSVLGSDYVDLTNNGPTPDDLGYWVKFTYRKVYDSYKWRTPYFQANYSPGFLSTGSDDKATYVYGEKEIYYLAYAETKTHIARFEIEDRKDATQALGEFVNNAGSGTEDHNTYKRLKTITLFSKLQGIDIPIKTVHFSYDYSLCRNADNNLATATGDNINKGKLTLKKIWFTYQNSKRGALNPYQFEYSDFNPSYNSYSVDRWGAYKPLMDEDDKLINIDELQNPNPDPPLPEADVCLSINKPYTDQRLDIDGNNIIDANDKAERDKWASAWHLTKIKLPSGGEVNVQYEQDDYAYVQDKQAMNMFKISRIGKNTPDGDNYCRIYAQGEGWDFNNHVDDDLNRKVYFDLKYNIDVADATAATKELKEYFNGVDQLYYKILIRLREPTCENYEEYTYGYATIDNYGFDENCENTEGTKYEKAFIRLKPEVRDGKPIDKYHPFTFNALQFLRSNLPQYTGTMGCGGSTPLSETGSSASSNDAAANNAQVLFGMMDNIKELFSNFYQYHTGCNSSDPLCDESAGNRNWCSIIDLDRSVIRLSTPDKIKYGGGSRVKSVRIKDNWSIPTSGLESDSEYGQVFEYTTKEGGKIISSGVASYEPIVGGEENPFRTVKEFPGRIPCKLDNNLMFEYPVNESYFPAASVGYSTVTVKSINTNKILKGESGHGYSASGVTVHEFYTAKEFPIITDETNIMKTDPKDWMQTGLEDFYKFHLWIPIPTIGQVTLDRLGFSQGYSIELNDMHGKPKKVSNYEIAANGTMAEEPISWVRYNYKFEEVTKNGKTFKKLVNDIPVLLSDIDPGDDTKAQIETRTVGVDYEMFSDMRYAMSYAANGGVSVNVKLAFIVPTPTGLFISVPIPVPWPNIGYNDKMVKIAVTNKIINRTGILESVEAFDGGSTVATKNWYWDEVTGDVLLSSATNNFDQPVFTYRYPSHWKYDLTGPAYKNLGLKIKASQITAAEACSGPQEYTFTFADAPGAQFLVPGDELIASGKKVFVTKVANDPGSSPPSGTVTIQTIDNNVSHLINGGYNDIEMYLVRSGRRNLLETKIANIVALKNPTQGRTVDECEKVLYALPTAEPCADFFANLVNNVFSLVKHRPNQITEIPANPVGATRFESYNTGSFRLVRPGFSSETNCRYAFFMGTSMGSASLPIHLLTGKLVPSTSAICGSSDAPGSVTIDGLSAANTGLVFTVHLTLPEVGEQDICLYLFRTGDCNCNDADNELGKVTMRSKTYSIEDVISASAIKMKDEWPLDNSDLRFPASSTSIAAILRDLSVTNIYAKGEKGIWRPHETYTYYTDREQSVPLDISKDGTFNMMLFDWNNPFFGECDANWVKSNEVTKYSPYSYETENKNALGIYSSALYSYNGSMPIAVAANAKENEIGFEGFEEYFDNESIDQYHNATGNIDITTVINNDRAYPAACTTYVEEYSAFGILGTGLMFTFSMDYNYLTDADIEVIVQKLSAGSASVDLPVDLVYNSTVNIGTPNNFSGHTILIDDNVGSLNNGAWWIGKIRITKHYNTPAQEESGPAEDIEGIEYTDEAAHTGKMSLKVTEEKEFIQDDLKLQTGKKYVLSAWVSRNNNGKYYNYSAGNPSLGMEVVFYNNSSTSVGTAVNIPPSGEIINGWQKIEGNFVVPANATKIALKFKPGTLSAEDNKVYFDDVRVFPDEGEIKTYVYNPRNYKVSAELDNNNYATYYYYNEQGDLFLVKKETVHGIQTIEENLQNIKNQ